MVVIVINKRLRILILLDLLLILGSLTDRMTSTVYQYVGDSNSPVPPIVVVHCWYCAIRRKECRASSVVRETEGSSDWSVFLLHLIIHNSKSSSSSLSNVIYVLVSHNFGFFSTPDSTAPPFPSLFTLNLSPSSLLSLLSSWLLSPHHHHQQHGQVKAAV